ncbi:lytic transglycosylase domain-containing protein [Bdellovibrio sp. NC01]|uniref:lytic transglycosylase domain-containing protein n=1 Tax=Bdellovibrio sp. NC01 TaxID=2220073 RepID=UPI001159FCB4|nr:lytic transglycosylase domain-containing protein [Bdellovibrio sp. NC01]QDK38301.1 lytic transglycosylase domain-containing protein [Bdellovibrio sp. NC01]
MKTKHLNSTLAVMTATLTLVLFNNFDFFSWNKPAAPSMEGVSEASRVSHAKELLGRNYIGSDAQKIEGRKSLNYMIYNKVQTQLPAQFKGHAKAITRTVIAESAKYHLDPVFVLAVIKTESKFNPLTVGRYGEIGLMQVKPDTAEWIAKKFKITWNGKQTLQNPESNIKIGLAYMNYLRSKFNSKPVRYVSAYNMGPGNMFRLISKNVNPNEYNSRVMRNYKELYAKLAVRPSITTVAAN